MGVEKDLDPYSSMWDWLTHDLRFLCKKYGLSHTELGKKLHRSRPHVSNILAGRRSIRDQDADILDTEYDTGGRYSILLSWARRGHSPNWFGQYKEFELQSRVIKTFEALTVPGLFQTPEYAQALVKALGDSDVDGVVARRMARQEILTKAEPPLIWALITENVLDWPIGGRDVMRKQLTHLLELGELPNIGLRVVERTAGAHAGVDGSFSLISGDFGHIAYTESPGAGRLVPSSTEVRSYEVRYDRIGQVASSESRSRDVIRKAMEAL
jgi:transcriptional regulator with XRE-family HTH domain